MIWRNNISLATTTSTSRWFLVFVPSFVSFYLRLESFTYRFSPPQAPSSSTFFVLKYRFSFVVIYFLFFSATIVGVQHYYCPFSTSLLTNFRLLHPVLYEIQFFICDLFLSFLVIVFENSSKSSV